MAGLDVLDRSAVAALLGVSPATVSNYLHRSKPGGVYEDHPFPTPDGYFVRRPYWNKDRADEIVRWSADRPGQGAGGGRPSHRVPRI